MTTPTSHKTRFTRAYSIAEVVTVIAILGVLAGIAVRMISNVISPSKGIIAENWVETLNQGVHRFNQSNYELLFTAVAPSGQDEMLILRTMQFRDPVAAKAKIGAPYIRNDWNPAISNKLTDYRIVWTGNLFKLAPPGTAGTGLKFDFEGRDITTPFVFPEGFNMAGK